MGEGESWHPGGRVVALLCRESLVHPGACQEGAAPVPVRFWGRGVWGLRPGAQAAGTGCGQKRAPHPAGQNQAVGGETYRPG